MMNQDSSRSHSIFTITIECIEKLEAAGTAVPAPGAGRGGTISTAIQTRDTEVGVGHDSIPLHTMWSRAAHGATCMYQQPVSGSDVSVSFLSPLLFIWSLFAGAKAADSNHVRVGKLNLVDLAGSERQDKTGATGGSVAESKRRKHQQMALT